MGKSFVRALFRAGVPALVLFVFWVVYGLTRREPGESLADLFVGWLGLFVILWLAAAVVVWLVKLAGGPGAGTD